MPGGSPCSRGEPRLSPTAPLPAGEVAGICWWERGRDRGCSSLAAPMLSLLGRKGSSPSSAQLWLKAALGRRWSRSRLVLFICVLVEKKENLGRTRARVLGGFQLLLKRGEAVTNTQLQRHLRPRLLPRGAWLVCVFSFPQEWGSFVGGGGAAHPALCGGVWRSSFLPSLEAEGFC